MHATKIDEPSQRASYTALAALSLSESEFEALQNQGFVSEEKRGKRSYYKLRFRQGRKQRVKYIGNAQRAAKVQQELLSLQSATSLIRELNYVTKIARKMLRDSKLAMKPLIESRGLEFHGLSIRKPRKQTNK